MGNTTGLKSWVEVHTVVRTSFRRGSFNGSSPTCIFLSHKRSSKPSNIEGDVVLHWQRIYNKIFSPCGSDYLIAPRMRIMLASGCGSLPNKSFPLNGDSASKPNYIERERALLIPIRSLTQANTSRGPRIVLDFAKKGRASAANHGAAPTRKNGIIVEPLRGSDAPGNKSAIHHIMD
jgi:hypothetical protein